MIWDLDLQTQQAAEHHPIPISVNEPANQFGGRLFNTNSWENRMIVPGNWPQGPIVSSPETIINEFQHERYLQGLALVVSWGKMWRTSNHIWGDRQLQVIQTALEVCAERIVQTESLEQAWEILTGDQDGQLNWSPVITSKTLHFICRALGHHENPPVAIDNAVILNSVWPSFIQNQNHFQRPGNWKGRRFAAYNRYMTAIITWANMRGWTTTEMEATIFNEY